MMKRITCSTLLALLLLAALTPQARAADQYVAPWGDDFGTGTPDNPRRTIQAGMDWANDGDSVYVFAGTYAGPGNVNLTNHGKDVAVLGGGPGWGTVIQLSSGESAFSYDGWRDDSDSGAAVIAGITIWSQDAAGIRITHCRPTIVACRFDGPGDGINTDDDAGLSIENCEFRGNRYGILCHDLAEPLVSNCRFFGCQTGMLCVYSNVQGVTECSFNNNGTGLFASDASMPVITDCAFTGNGAAGIDAEISYLVLDRCLFSGNAGTGINAFETWMTLAGSSFVRNRAGGLILDNEGERVVISNSYFLGNRGATTAGGVDASIADGTEALAIVNSVFVGNRGGSAGGALTIHAQSYGDVNADITNCTFARNHGGLAVPSSGGYPANVRVTNCVLWRNYGVDLLGAYATYSDVGTGVTAGEGNLNVYPQFLGYPSQGQDGIWGTEDDDYGDLRLGNSSPCYNAGTLFAPALPTTDAIGAPRVIANRPDMGAFELLSIVRNIAPHSVRAGSPGFVMTINGNFFGEGAVLRWDGMPLPTQFISQRRLEVLIPPFLVQSPHAVDLEIITDGLGPRRFHLPFEIRP